MNALLPRMAAALALSLLAGPALHAEPAEPVLNALRAAPGQLEDGSWYLPTTPATARWGTLPNRGASAVLHVPSGAIVTIDTVSHEGILEDQGRDPLAFFGRHGIPASGVLDDARAIAASSIAHDFRADGPHVVTGPIAIEGARPGDVLRIEVLSLQPRVAYGVVSNRHGKGALAGEFPETDPPDADADADDPAAFRNVSVFTPVRRIDGALLGELADRSGAPIRFPLRPFMGLMGVAPDTDARVHSVPPALWGGNLDIAELGVGSTLYLPVLVPDALFYAGDPHFAQGNGEVALTALEAPLRATFRLTVLNADDPANPTRGLPPQPFAETPEHWIPIGLDPDLDEAMRQAVRRAVDFLSTRLDVDRAVALAYLSAATDFEISQVVDATKGVHALLRKADFAPGRRPDAHASDTLKVPFPVTH